MSSGKRHHPQKVIINPPLPALCTWMIGHTRANLRGGLLGVPSSVDPDSPCQAEGAAHQPLASLLVTPLALTGRGESMYPLTATHPTNVLINNFFVSKCAAQTYVRDFPWDFKGEVCIGCSVDAEIFIIRKLRLEKFKQ